MVSVTKGYVALNTIPIQKVERSGTAFFSQFRVSLLSFPPKDFLIGNEQLICLFYHVSIFSSTRPFEQFLLFDRNIFILSQVVLNLYIVQ